MMWMFVRWRQKLRIIRLSRSVAKYHEHKGINLFAIDITWIELKNNVHMQPDFLHYRSVTSSTFMIQMYHRILINWQSLQLLAKTSFLSTFKRSSLAHLIALFLERCVPTSKLRDTTSTTWRVGTVLYDVETNCWVSAKRRGMMVLSSASSWSTRDNWS